MASDRRSRVETLGAMNGGLDEAEEEDRGGDASRHLAMLFDRPTANPGSEVCTLDHVINRCAREVKPSQFSSVDDEEDLAAGASLYEARVVTDAAVLEDMRQCVREAVREPCKGCEPCGKGLLDRITDETFVTQDATVDELVKCYSKKGEEQGKCFGELPYKARFVGRDGWGRDFYAPDEE